MGGTAQIVVVAAALMALAACLTVWSLTTTSGEARQRMLTNLRRDFGRAPAGGNDSGAVEQSPVRLFARRLTPRASVALLDRLLSGAGRPAAWPIERVLVVKLLLALLLGALALLGWSTGNASLGRAMVLGIGLTFVGWFFPELLLYNASTKRRKAITRALPDVLDQLTIAVEAGLGFEAALAHVGRSSAGPLGDELIRTLQDIQIGISRRDAYRGLADRCQVDDLSRFVRAIGQAEQYGVSVASVLEAQAQEMRLKRKQRAEEAALKIPVKVVFPLTIFILPTLFIVVLGPAVLNIIETFPRGGIPGT